MRHIIGLLLLGFLFTCVVYPAVPVSATPLGAQVMFTAVEDEREEGSIEPSEFDVTLTYDDVNINYIWNGSNRWELDTASKTYNSLTFTNNIDMQTIKVDITYDSTTLPGALVQNIGFSGSTSNPNNWESAYNCTLNSISPTSVYLHYNPKSSLNSGEIRLGSQIFKTTITVGLSDITQREVSQP